MLYLLHVFAALLAFSATAQSQSPPQSDDPLYNYEPNTRYTPRMLAESISIIPLTNGWEYINNYTGLAPSGDTWESQRGESDAKWRNYAFEWRLRTSLPGQAVGIAFVGDGLKVKAQVDLLDDNLDLDRLPVDILGAPLSMAVDWSDSRTEGTTLFQVIQMTMPDNTYYNITLRTLPELASYFTIELVDWNTTMMTQGLGRRKDKC